MYSTVYYTPFTVPEIPTGWEDGIVHEAAQDETQHKVWPEYLQTGADELQA